MNPQLVHKIPQNSFTPPSSSSSSLPRHAHSPQEFESSTPSCAGLDYGLDISAPTPVEMRYNQDASNSPLTIEAPPQPPPFISFPQQQVTAYSPDSAGSFYPPGTHVFGIDHRPPRLGSNSTSSSGMAHAPRPTTLPHPVVSTRDLYTPATPSYRRPEHHAPRSPSFAPSFRRHPLSPSPSLNYGAHPYTARVMENSYGSRSQTQQQNIPPLTPLVSFGTLSYGDGQPIKIDIQGIIDKGFFLADSEWTCYRRNYFSCICSFSLSSYFANQPMQYLQTGAQQPHQVYGFAMSISAIVAENESQSIELVQHTPKRDKGPIVKPDKVRLTPKSPTHHPMNVFSQTEAGRYDQSAYVSSQSSYPTEHTFERIQFKQATANNGKRRAAQQYYHLLVELWADVGAGREGSSNQFIKIAQRKSAKMIVRGRSPGHYQGERRGSTSSGPGSGGAGSIGGTGYSSMTGADYPGSTMLPGPGAYSYDPRPPGYGGNRHHHELTMTSMIAPEEEKTLAESKGYQYYPHTLYENEHDTRNQLELFAQHRNEGENAMVHSHAAGGMDLAPPRVPKIEMEGGGGGLPSLFNPPPAILTQRCGRFEGKPASTGFYPTPMLPPTSTMNMT